MQKFDYYVFVDYSENLIGYAVLNGNNLENLLSKTTKLKHYRDVKHRKEYLKAIKKVIENNDVKSIFLKIKIREKRLNEDILLDIVEFLKINEKCKIFISVDNKQHPAFVRLVNILNRENVKVVKESELKKNSPEYRASLIIDNLLNIERIKNIG